MVGCQKSAKGYQIFILIKRNIKSRITMNKIGRKYKNTKKSQNGWTKLWHNQLMCVHAVHHITSDIMPGTEK